MRWILLALFALSAAACPPKDVPDPPAVGASAKDGQKSRQPAPPRVGLPAPPEESALTPPPPPSDAAADVVTGPDEAADAGQRATPDAAASEAGPGSADRDAPALDAGDPTGAVGDAAD